MLALFVTIKVKPGQELSFEEVAKELVDKVNANEPGCALYQLSRSQTEHTYHFMERYVDEAALAAHRTTSYFKEIGARMGAHMEGRPVVLALTEV